MTQTPAPEQHPEVAAQRLRDGYRSAIAFNAIGPAIEGWNATTAAPVFVPLALRDRIAVAVTQALVAELEREATEATP